MVRREKFDQAGNLLEAEELEETSPGVFEYRHFAAPDFVTPDVTRPATGPEAAYLESEEDGEREESARKSAALDAALDDVLAVGVGNSLITILVAGGIVPAKRARARGWVAP